MAATLRRESIVATGVLNPLGVFFYSNKIYLIYRSERDETVHYRLASSDDGFNFEMVGDKGSFQNNNLPLDLNHVVSMRFSNIAGDLYAVFRHENRAKSTYIAKFKSLLEWEIISSSKSLTGSGVILQKSSSADDFIFIGGKNEIKFSISSDLVNWNSSDTSLISGRPDNFDSGQLNIQGLIKLPEGNLVLYESKQKNHICVGGVILDKNDPDIILWRSNQAIWQTISEWSTQKTVFLGAVELHEKIISYWHVEAIGIYAVVYLHKNHHLTVQSKNISLFLDRHVANPLITPKQDNAWEAFTTFNPAAIYEAGKVHILYRAQGYDYSSVVGYAASSDGINIDERHDKPCYVPKEDFEATGTPSSVSQEYVSGGGYGGCEDPRITKIDDRIYMTYVAFNGSSEPRIALTSISLDDFLNHRWFWEKPVLISPPGIIDKSPCIFPEKIKGKYVILHRVFPNILIDYVDSLDFDGKTWLKGEDQIKIRLDHWDSRKIGAGAPPIRTKDGWLLIYYSVDERDAGRYKIGAMLLDLENPSKVLHRTNNPILEPNARYENEGFKAGVAYPCGAVVIDQTLFVYYGAADTYVCVATANLDEFLSELKFANLAKLEPAYIRPIK